MVYCPKCQQTYDAELQRFCLKDGARLQPAPTSGKTVNQSAGIFTAILNKSVSGNAPDEKLSSAPNLARIEPDNHVEPRLIRANEGVLKSEANFQFKTELKILPQKPLPRIIKPSEIPASQARLGDRRTNPAGRPALTRENTAVMIGQTIKNRYRITQKLNEDEASVAYLAEDKIVPNKKVVVRVLINEPDTADFADKIFAEERISLSLVNHPNVARILDSGELLEGKPFMISEFADGVSIKELLLEAGQFTRLRTARIISQAADALSEAHRNGVLHRNLKPEDIILTVSETGGELVKVTNFGNYKESLTKENAVYKSPEQLDGKPANFAGDIYSLAVIAFQMLTNRLPFNNLSIKDLRKSQRETLNLHPTNLRLDVPREVDRILEKALSLNPSQRYPKIREFGDSLAHALTTINASDDAPELGESELVTDEDVDNAIKHSRLLISEKELKLLAKEPEPLAAEVFQPTISPPENNKQIELVEQEELKFPSARESAWEKRSSESPKVFNRNLMLISLLGVLLLIGGIWGLWYVLNRPPESPVVELPKESVFPKEEENINAAAPTPREIEIPPLPRTISQPPNTVYFQNGKEGLKGDLAKNFLGFSLYYPKDWKQNDAQGKFLDISKDAPSGTPVEQMLVSYYDSKGTFTADTASFPALVKETNTTLKEIVPNYAMISEGEKAINNGWRAYEVKFTGSGKTANGENITLWGRRLFIPTNRPGMKNGYVVTMLATSLSADVKNVEDVGVKGELAPILESFEPNQNF